MKSEKPMIKRIAPLLIVLAVLMVVVAVAAPTIARYIINANSDIDDGGDYTPAESGDPSFSLGDEVNKMENVRIAVEDKGYPVYVRVAIIITWQNEDGDVLFPQPIKDEDYTIDINESSWKSVGGFYYFTSPLVSGETDVLINSCALIEGGDADLPDGYVLNVEIIAQTVQAIGSTDNGNVPAWRDAWGIG